ncbi:hypothetical protein BBOV_III008490 [Babesia bovis T2Bo]|uniref:Surp module family protein n=1 Tax=Babesia bovis TaxID=5865 RepID=A7APC5_BABBO|nr:hypothetical protein BBOV_III008490 [Babesia bovis T2Bo]EDO08409.1 hypothetical protein BBOV_III008490 [Babesia bovis T2Bo]|eukprot:XP_001611977.1 surp module family protein [Babesia bovis T2Bo]
MAHVVGRLKKQKEDDLAKEQERLETARIYSEYVRDFESTGLSSETSNDIQFVKSGQPLNNPDTSNVFSNADADSTALDEHGAEYLNYVQPAPHTRRIAPGKTKEIDAFIQELKEKQQRQEAEKALQRKGVSSATRTSRFCSPKVDYDIHKQDTLSQSKNALYISNLPLSVQQFDVERLCSRYGAIDHVSIVPVTTGPHDSVYAVVIYRDPTDAACAKDDLDGKEIYGRRCEINWGYQGAIPSQFTGQMHNDTSTTRPLLAYSDTVDVCMPMNPAKRAVIDLTARYVAEIGADYEYLLISNEKRDGLFSFLHDRCSPEHVYYRWKVYSLLQNDTDSKWRTDGFCVITDGLVWYPPTDLTQPRVPDPLLGIDPASLSQNGKTPMQQSELRKLESILSNATTIRGYIADAMMFMINHGESAVQVTDCLVEYIMKDSPTVDTKISRLYILSDVLYNTSASHQFGWIYRLTFEKKIPEVFAHIREYIKSSTSKIAVQELISCVERILNAWHQWDAYPQEYLYGLESMLWGPYPSEFVTLPIFDQHRDIIDPGYDGDEFILFDLLSRFTLKWRPVAYEYSLMRLKKLKQLCQNRGVVSTPYTRESMVTRLIIYDIYVESRVERSNLNAEIGAGKTETAESDSGSSMEFEEPGNDISAPVETEIVHNNNMESDCDLMLKQDLTESQADQPSERVEIQETVSPCKFTATMDDDIDDMFATDNSET